MQRIIVMVLLTVALATAASGAQALEIFFIDVEGGASTLIVTPAGQSLLIDAGRAPQTIGSSARCHCSMSTEAAS